jgi:AcrR family transcriptional regulator
MATTTRELTSDKAQRIVDAMRASIGVRGAAGSTFDHVAREAGVSRGLLHYYFGTKERLLVEVCRRDCDIRMGVLDEALAAARTSDELIDALVRSLQDLLRDDPQFVALFFELFTTSRHHPEIAAGVQAIARSTREHLAAQLEAKAREGIVRLGADADAVATVLFSIADGLALRMLADPDHDYGQTIEAGVQAVRPLLRPPAA